MLYKYYYKKMYVIVENLKNNINNVRKKIVYELHVYVYNVIIKLIYF